MKKYLLILAIAILGIGLITMADSAFFSLAQATPIVTASLNFYDGIDMETGNIKESSNLYYPFSEAVDFYFGYDALSTIHAFLVQLPPAEFAFMDEVSFSNVTFDDVATLSFTSFFDLIFENDDTIVVLTALGNYFKVGNAMENDTSVIFDYQQLVPVPEPATFLLIGTGIAGIAGMRFRRKKK